MNPLINTSTPVSEIIALRTSRRTYLPQLLTPDDEENIRQLISQCTEGPLGTKMSIGLVAINDFVNAKLKLGTYGFIQGARYFIAGQIIPSKEGFLDYGYVLEKLILELTAMGLGTCWLGGTFDRSEFARAIGLQEGWVIPAITPVGYASSSRRLGELLIRAGAGANNRLPWDRLFFDGKSAGTLILSEQHPYRLLMESVRTGPSASNNQPWRIVADGNRFRFYISRKPGYQKAFSQIDMQMIDIGIAMAHFDLVARETGYFPVWEISSGTAPFAGWEYVISVILPE